MKNRITLLALMIVSLWSITSVQDAFAQDVDVQSEPVNRFKMPLNKYPLERNLQRQKYVNAQPTTVRSGSAPRGLLGLQNFAVSPAPLAIPAQPMSKDSAAPSANSPFTALYGHPQSLHPPLMATARDAQPGNAQRALPAHPMDAQKKTGYKFVPQKAAFSAPKQNAAPQIASYNGKFFGQAAVVPVHSDPERTASTSVAAKLMPKH